MSLKDEIVEATQQLVQNNPNSYSVAKLSNDFDYFYDVFRYECKHLKNICMDHSRTVFRNVVMEAHWHMRWFAFGMPVFRLTKELLTNLALTDPGECLVTDARYPYSSFLVEIPRNFWIINSYGIEHRKEVYDKSEEYDVLCYAFHRQMNAGNDVISLKAMSSGGFQIWDTVYINRVPYKDFKMGFDQGNELAGSVSDAEKRILRSLHRVNFNLALYIAEKGKGNIISRNPNDKKKKSKKIKPIIWEVGRNIKIPDSRLINAAKSCVTPRYKVQCQFVVRGHYRNQPCGPGRTQTKRIWIEPFWKGPDGPRLSHNYEF